MELDLIAAKFRHFTGQILLKYGELHLLLFVNASWKPTKRFPEKILDVCAICTMETSRGVL